MTRSLFFALFYRCLLATVLVGMVCSGLGNALWLVKVALIVAAALAVAAISARDLQRALYPIEQSAVQMTQGAFPAAAVPYRDLEETTYVLARASSEVAQTLHRADESRHELEALLDSMQDAVVAVDTAGRIQWTNDKMRQLMTGDAVSGSVRVGHALVQTVRDPEVLACVRDALEKRVVCERRSLSLLPGSIFEISASPMPGGGAVAVLHDITRIEEIERTQREFVANVSHELRTPLTSISGYVETLIEHEESLRPQAKEFLATILKNTGRMSRLTEDLLVLAKVESREKKMNPVPARADVLVSDAVKAMAGLIQDSDAVLEMGPLTSSEVLADVDAVTQVLSNLIENAVKYGRSRSGGSSRVVMSAEQGGTAHPQMVLFKVRDFGTGIASEHLSRIFERFYRVDKARSRESGGTGLGLAIAQHVIHSHGGTIWAESELNQGSTFCFTLPERRTEP